MVHIHQRKSQTHHEIRIGQKLHRTSSCFSKFQAVCPPIFQGEVHASLDGLYPVHAKCWADKYILHFFATEIKNE